MADAVRILYLAANPETSARLRLQAEVRRVQALIRASEHRDALELVTRWEVRPDDLQQELLEVRPHILHFSGHGTRDGEVVMEGDGHGEKLVDNEAIVDLTRILRDNLRVVVLNACYSERLARALTEHIDCAIGTRRDIGDEAAVEFAAAFYRAVGFGRSVEQAYELGCNASALQGIAGAGAHELLARNGVDPSELILLGDAEAAPAVADAPEPADTDDDVPTGQASVRELVGELVDKLGELRDVGPDSALTSELNMHIDALVSAIKRRFSPTEGSIVAGAKLIRVSGSGNFGTIWEGKAVDTGDRVAVKVFRLERLAEGQMLSRFQRSIRAMRLLSEEKRLARRDDTRGQVVRFRGQDASSLAFAMDFLNQGNLEKVEQQGWSLERKLEVMVSVCSAVEYAHHNGVIHRDIKPANIVLDGAQKPVLTDFDISDIKWATSLSTTVEGGLGTPVFAAPEQLVDADSASERSDVYSLGRLLYYLLLERSPGYEIEKDPTLANLGGQPPAIVELIRRATQHDPLRRHASVADMIAQLERCHTGAAAARARAARAWRWVRHNRALLAIVAMLLAGAVGFAVFQTRLAHERKEALERVEAEKSRTEGEKARADQALAQLTRLTDRVDELDKRDAELGARLTKLRGEVAVLEEEQNRAPPDVRRRIAKDLALKYTAISEVETKQAQLRVKLNALRAELRKTVMEARALERKRDQESAPDYLIHLGKQYFQRNQTQKAVEVWKKIIARKTPENYVRLGEVYSEHDLLTESLMMYSEAIKLQPEYVDHYKGRARVFERRREYMRAVADWERVLALTPNKPARREARQRVVSLLKRARGNRLYRRKQGWIKAFNRTPPDIESGYFLAEVYLRDHELAKARQTLERLLNINGKDVEVMQELVKVYKRERAYDKAVALLRRLAELHPERKHEYDAEIAEISAE